MKRILSTALAIVLFIGAAQAQHGQEKKDNDRKHGDMMKELSLTDEQKAKIKAIREAQQAEIKTWKAEDKAEDKTSRKEMHEKYKSQIDAVLTTEQKDKLKAGKKDGAQKHQKGAMKHKMDKSDRKDKMHEFGKELNLSADQQARVKAINEEFRTKMQALRNNTTLSPEIKKEEFKQLAESHRKSLKAVLTAEQVAKMEAGKKDHKGKKASNL